MKPLIDLHCHTVASGHAYSTIQEMIEKAKQKGLKALGISDHAPSMPGACDIYSFYNLIVLPEEVDGLVLLKGVEANIMDFEGTLDMPEMVLENLDFVIASLHLPCIEPGTIEENTRAIIKTIENPNVNIIGHPDDTRYPLNYDAIVKAAKEHNVALEINNSSLRPDSYRVGAQETVTTILELCKKYECKVIFGSDAHISYDVGNFIYCLEAVKNANFPMELVINYSKESINDFLGKDIL